MSSEHRPDSILHYLTIVFIVVIFSLQTCYGEGSETIVYDFSTLEPATCLNDDSLEHSVCTKTGICPSRPQAPNWVLKWKDFPEIDFQEYPFLIIELSAFEETQLEIDAHWHYRYRDWGSGNGSVKVFTGVIPANSPREIVIDLRRSAHGILGKPSIFHINLHRYGHGSHYPEIHKVTFSQSNLALLSSDRFRRITSPDNSHKPLMTLILISAILLVIAIHWLISKLTPGKKTRQTRTGSVSNFCLAMIALWSVLGLLFFTSLIQTLPVTIWSNCQKSPESIRTTIFGNWYNIVDAARDLLPEDARVGVLCNDSFTETQCRHFASYWLYPREITLDYQEDYILLIQSPAMTEQLLNDIKSSGHFLVAASDSHNFLFSKTPPDLNIDEAVKVDPKDLKLSGSRNTSRLPAILDGDFATRWDTSGPMHPGDFIQVELAEPTTIHTIRCWHYSSWDDYPRGYTVEYSVDNSEWFLVKTENKPGYQRGFVEASLPDSPVRHLRITQTGLGPGFYWSVHELELFKPSTEDKDSTL